MSGRINRIPIESAFPQCQSLFLARLATPPQRIELIQENLEEKSPFQYELSVGRYIFLEQWTHEKLSPNLYRDKENPELLPEAIIETATVMEFMNLHVARRYHNEGVRKIPIYDCLDVPESNDDKALRLLFVTQFHYASRLYELLGAAPLSALDQSLFQSKN